jgi:hypothetical protein
MDLNHRLMGCNHVSVPLDHRAIDMQIVKVGLLLGAPPSDLSTLSRPGLNITLRKRWGGRGRTYNFLVQSQAFCH